VADNTANDGVYVGTDVGVFYRDNTMTDWVPFFNQLPNVIVKEMKINTLINKLFAGTFGRGIWQADLYGDCNYSYSLTNANNPSNNSTQYYAASHHISSTRDIYSSYSNTSVSYRAGEYVSLNLGFHAHTGSDFGAFLGPCLPTAVNAPPYNIRDRVSGQCIESYSVLNNSK